MCEGLEFLSFVFSFIKQDDFLNCSPSMGTTTVFIITQMRIIFCYLGQTQCDIEQESCAVQDSRSWPKTSKFDPDQK